MTQCISDTLFVNAYIYNKLSEPLTQYKLLNWGWEHHRKNDDIYPLVNQPFSVTFKQDMYDAWLLIETNNNVFAVSLTGDDDTVSNNYQKMLGDLKQLLSKQ